METIGRDMNLPFSLSRIFAGLALVAAPVMTRGQDMASSATSPALPKTEVVKANKTDLTRPGDPVKSSPIILVGDVGTAQDASFMPDRRYIGVYMLVDKDYPRTPDFIISKIAPFFEVNGLPVKFIKQENPPEGKFFSMRIYVGGQSYGGDMSNGNVTFPEFRDNHPKIFATLKEIYAKMNPELDLSFTPR